jgi:VRR-NUC domain-containing protein
MNIKLKQLHQYQLHLFKSSRQRGVAVDVRGSEFQLQCAVADTLKRWAAPNWVYTHIPLGEERTTAAGARLKRMGTMPGFPDFILLPPAGAPEPHAHFLELKRQGGKLSELQASFQLWCMLNGYPFAVADSYEAALAILQQWGAVRTGVHVQ